MRIYAVAAAGLSIALALGGCARTTGSGAASSAHNFGQTQQVAVVSVKGVPGEAAKGQITDIVNQRLLQKGYSPVERTQIKSVVQEQQFQSSQMTSASGAARVGDILNVDAAMIVNVPRYKEEMSMSAKLVDVDNGQIVWSGSGTARTGEALAEIGSAVAGSTLGAIAGGAATDSAAGAVAGGAAGAAGGAVAGSALSPQKQKQARKLVTKLLKSLPSRAATG
jgi:hypothetical protein